MRRSTPHHFGLLVVIAAALAVGTWMSVASASVLYADHFTYPDGNLVGQGTAPAWYAHSAGGSNPILVEGNRAKMGHRSTSSEDITKQFTPAQGAAAKTYASFILVVPSPATLTADDYFAHFKPYPTAADTFKYTSRLYVSPFLGGDYTVGVSATSSGTSPVVKWPSALTFGTAYRIVTSYDAATGTSELWVDPVYETSPKVTSVSATVIGLGIGAYCLRQGTAQTSTEYVDDLLIGQSFVEVTPPIAPSLTQWGVVALALLLLGAGAAFVLRRRTALA